MQTIKCFEVYGNTDTTEGRGPMKVVARFTNKEAAVAYVRSVHYCRWCVMGYQNFEYDVRNIHEATLIILDNMNEWEAANIADTKVKALAKLTDEERKALGL